MYYKYVIIRKRGFIMENVTNLSKHIPMYIQIKKDLQKKIFDGVYSADEMLPSESELIKIYGVSRVTIRKALNELEKESIITRRAGYGTTINHDHKELKKFTSVKSFTNEMKESGVKTETFSSVISIVFADADLMKIFNCDYSAKIYNLKRVRGYDKKPIVYSNTYLKLPFDLPTDKEFLFGSLYKYLIDNNILFSRFDEELEAVMPSHEMRQLLQLDNDGIVLKRVRKGYGVDNSVVEYTINYYDSKLYKYTIEAVSLEK